MESTFGSRVREFRKSKRLSQEAFAEQCGLEQGNITQMERGTDPKSGNMAKIIAGFPDLNPDWLLLGAGSMLRDGRELTRMPTDPIPAKVEAAPLQAVAEPETEREKELARRVRWLEGQVDLWQRIATSGVDLTKLQATGTDGSFLMGEYTAAKNEPTMWAVQGGADEMAA